MPETPTVIDLFAGVGGLSLGAARAGFKVLAAVENDPIASASHTKNFPTVEHFNDDIRKLKGNVLLKRLDMEAGQLTGLVGGPPCQGFSNMGHRSGNDGRSYLFYHFFRLVDELRPAFFVAENVPGILNAKFDRIREMAFAKIPSLYTRLEPIKINASEYGVPTKRTRVFFIGYDASKFQIPVSVEDFLPPADTETITVERALDGLPLDISEDWNNSGEWRSVEKKNGSRFMANVTANRPKGLGDEETVKLYDVDSLVSGCQGTRHIEAVIDRFDKLAPGETDKVSRAARLKADGFCPTLRAGTARDKGSFQAIRPIHPTQPRVITPREAARLQGFPDWFVFHETKWHSFRQIGNSVSPIIAESVLRVLRRSVRGPFVKTGDNADNI